MHTKKEQITIVIPFLNEKGEVEKTLASIREFSGNVPIILINDASDDGFDYKTVADRFGADYVRNEERQGVARSRDLGIERAATQYFLLLDAHMRFYEPGWEDKLCSFLKENPRSIVCCQNIPLYKTEEGYEVSPERGYGAKLSLFNSATNGFLQLYWNTVEAEKDSPTEEIACVLGAAYASSKRFWREIRGLEGLRQYGSDEAYLSLKTWLAGGKCVLFKTIAIGHVYRKAFPYTVQSFYMVFNVLFIVKTLFPPKYFIYVLLMMKKTFTVDVLGNAYRTYLENLEAIEGLRKYLLKKRKHDFSIIEKLNDLAFHGFNVSHRPKKIQTIFEKVMLNFNAESNFGLNGKMGMLIFLFIHQRANKTPKFHFFLQKQLNKLLEKIEYGLSDHFYNGIFGIGWALEYFMQHGLISRSNRDDVLADIDENVLKFDFAHFSDWSLGTGLIGILHFVLARITDRNEEHSLFTREFVKRRIGKIKPNDSVRCSSLELLEKLKYYAYGGNLIGKISISDILDFGNSNIDTRSNDLFGGLSFIGTKQVAYGTDLFV